MLIPDDSLQVASYGWDVLVVGKQPSAIQCQAWTQDGDGGTIDVVYGAIYDDSTFLFQPHSAHTVHSGAEGAAT